MRQDDRAPFERALHRARVSAYGPGEFVGQESFMTAGEIRDLAARARIARGVTVLDLCCGIAGPGRFVTRELGCAYLGVDASASAIDVARERADDLPCRFAVAQVPPLPAGPFDVVLLLETMLAFEDKDALIHEIVATLRPGGRFGFTLEEGRPLTAAERTAMPDADTVWLTPLDEMTATLERAGLVVTWHEDHSRAHRAVAQALADAFSADAEAIAAQVGRRALDELLAAHRLWVDWLDAGRVRKLALVAEQAAERRDPPERAAPRAFVATSTTSGLPPVPGRRQWPDSAPARPLMPQRDGRQYDRRAD
jgi:SAM-dependent methyltransferase